MTAAPQEHHRRQTWLCGSSPLPATDFEYSDSSTLLRVWGSSGCVCARLRLRLAYRSYTAAPSDRLTTTSDLTYASPTEPLRQRPRPRPRVCVCVRALPHARRLPRVHGVLSWAIHVSFPRSAYLCPLLHSYTWPHARYTHAHHTGTPYRRIAPTHAHRTTSCLLLFASHRHSQRHTDIHVHDMHPYISSPHHHTPLPSGASATGRQR